MMASTTLFDSPYKKATQAEYRNRFHQELLLKTTHLDKARWSEQKSAELIKVAQEWLAQQKSGLSSLSPEAQLLLQKNEKKLESYQTRLEKLRQNISRLAAEVALLEAEEHRFEK